MMNHTIRTAALAAALAAVAALIATPALALDGYQDRRGLFSGLTIGGGAGSVASDEGLTGFQDGRKLGFHFGGMLGGGLSQQLVAGVEANAWIRTVELGDDIDSQNTHLNFSAVGNFYLLDGFYLEGGAGLAYAIFDAQMPRETIKYRELGLAVKGGAGFEFFVNSQTAVGLTMNYTRHFYTNASFDTVTGGITLRWY